MLNKHARPHHRWKCRRWPIAVISALLVVGMAPGLGCTIGDRRPRRELTIDLNRAPSKGEIGFPDGERTYVISNRTAPLPITLVDGERRYRIEAEFAGFNNDDLNETVDGVSISLGGLTKPEMLAEFERWLFDLTDDPQTVADITEWLTGPLPYTDTSNRAGWDIRKTPKSWLRMLLRYYPSDPSGEGGGSVGVSWDVDRLVRQEQDRQRRKSDLEAD